MKNEQLLHDEIASEFEVLKGLEVGTDEYKTTVDGLTKLMDRAIEIDKMNLEAEEKVWARESDVEIKKQQLKDEKIDRMVKNGLTGVSVIGGLGVTIWGALKSWKFEETGTVTSAAGREFIKKLFTRK